MIEVFRQMLVGVTAAAILAGVSLQFVKEGPLHEAVRVAAGLMLTLALLRPLTELQWTEPELAWDGPAQEALAEAYRQDREEALSAVIAEKTRAYIWDKADRLGLRCTVEVTVSAGESGIPLPDTVTVRGSYSAALAAYIEEEVGVPPEKQIWLEEETWKRENEINP